MGACHFPYCPQGDRKESAKDAPDAASRPCSRSQASQCFGCLPWPPQRTGVTGEVNDKADTLLLLPGRNNRVRLSIPTGAPPHASPLSLMPAGTAQLWPCVHHDALSPGAVGLWRRAKWAEKRSPIRSGLRPPCELRDRPTAAAPATFLPGAWEEMSLAILFWREAFADVATRFEGRMCGRIRVPVLSHRTSEGEP